MKNYPACRVINSILSVESKPPNSDFYQNDFVSAGIPNAWPTFCQILVALDQLESPYKASIMLQNIVSMKNNIILVLIFTEIQGFAIKQMLKMS